MTERKEIAWCLDCGGRYTHAETEGHNGCPGCGSEGIACDPNLDLTVEVNWHELRVLVIWAENWAHKINTDSNEHDHVRTIHAIARRIRGQYPNNIPLTLSEEIAELPATMDYLGISVTGLESNAAKPPLIPVNGPGAVGHVKRSSDGP